MKPAALFFLLAAASANAGVVGFVSNGSTLYKIDGSNAAILNSVGLSHSNLVSMAFDPSGNLFGLFLTSGSFGHAGTIDPTNGAVSLLPQLVPLSPLQALAFDGHGQAWVYSMAGIRTLDLTTGTAGAAFNCQNFGTGGMAFDHAGNAVATTGSLALAFIAPGQGCGSGSSGSSGTGSSGSTGSTGSGGGSRTGSGTTPPSDQLITVYSLSSTFYGVRTNSDGAFLSTFNPSNASNTITNLGQLPTGTTSLALQSTDFAPEPAAIWLFGLGAAGMLLYRRYR